MLLLLFVVVCCARFGVVVCCLFVGSGSLFWPWSFVVCRLALVVVGCLMLCGLCG